MQELERLRAENAYLQERVKDLTYIKELMTFSQSVATQKLKNIKQQYPKIVEKSHWDFTTAQKFEDARQLTYINLAMFN